MSLQTSSRSFAYCAALIGSLAFLPARAAESPTSQAAGGGLVVMQISTTDPAKLMENWGKEGDGVQIDDISVIRRNQPVATFILFSGCRPNADGHCNVTADFEVIAPNGAVHERLQGAKVWVDKPAPPPKGIGLSEGGLGLRIEDKDEVGGYLVRATVIDHNSGVRLQTSKTLTALD